MDLLIDIAVYGIAVVVCIVVVLFMVGLFSGLTFSAQAYIDERRLQRSGHRAQAEFHDFATRLSERIPHRSTSMARDVAMASVVYPSRTFEKDTDRFIDDGIPFVVTVAAGSRKRAVVERELRSKIHFQPHRGRLMRDILDTFRTMGLWACVANALNHQYFVAYDVAADITIQFDPKPPPSP